MQGNEKEDLLLHFRAAPSEQRHKVGKLGLEQRHNVVGGFDGVKLFKRHEQSGREGLVLRRGKEKRVRAENGTRPNWTHQVGQRDEHKCVARPNVKEVGLQLVLA